MQFDVLQPWRAIGLGLAALALWALSAPADAQWKWRDSRGQVHISDTPPPRDVPEKDVLQRPDPGARRAPAPAAASPGAVPSAAAKPPVDAELEDRKRKADQEQAARKEADERQRKKAREENCNRAREQLATMESGMRIARVRPDGEREYLTDAQRASEAQRARDAIASDCR